MQTRLPEAGMNLEIISDIFFDISEGLFFFALLFIGLDLNFFFSDFPLDLYGFRGYIKLCARFIFNFHFILRPEFAFDELPEFVDILKNRRYHYQCYQC